MKKYIIIGIVLVVAGLLYGVIDLANAKKQKEDLISYNRDIRPVLSDKCFSCHGPDVSKVKAGLRLDLPASAFAELEKNKGHFAIVPGNPEKSELIKRVSSNDPAIMMPVPESHLARLTTDEIKLFTKWIEQGAKYEKHWAFVAPVKEALPEVDNTNWVKNEIDPFILEKMEAKGFEPNETASREALIKRAFADITGLAPSYEELNAWRNNNSDNWYTQLLDKLLQKPAYGEKMALLWMDLARYADSYGFQDDNIRSQWPWRDWVINAFNTNMHYDQFLTQQIAGDLLPTASKSSILATAFFRNHKYTEEGGVIEEEYRVSYNIDKTRTYGKAILGVTIECAQCHDHKYDPFSNKDYYQLYAFFNMSKEKGYEGDVSISTPAKNPKLFITKEEQSKLLSFINHVDTNKLEVSVMGDWKMGDTGKVRPTYILSRGSYDAPTTIEVKPTALESIMPFDTLKYERNRLGLAKWTVEKTNPLTARVFVNFIWQEIFGKGFVKTSSDYGLQGELPSHPALLDWLAVDFMEHNWDVKYLMKKILSSNTYQQSSVVTKKQLEQDPDNIYYTRSPRIRFKAEIVRDWVLGTSGILNPMIGGPSVKPYQPKGVWESTTSGRGVLASYKQDHGPAIYRRGLYTFIKLTAPPPSMMIFDASNRDQCEAKRASTNTPLQALTMLNDPAVLEASRVLAENISVTDKSLADKLEQAFETIVIRKPSRFERNKLMDYCEKQVAFFNGNAPLLKNTLAVGEYQHPAKKYNEAEAAALMKTILILYNLEETITKS
ncbi:MAG: PSD1 and planctomycete cytochrome C domain-containing protein [Chitinophagaceae bacterium]|nr:PSD1 and planctomycete cytochrome C domain-containing protein [Chitinophagaceae bacterium]